MRKMVPNSVVALDWVRQGESFDVAILDAMMPEMDELQLAAEIRKYRGDQPFPLLMLNSVDRRSTNKANLQFVYYLTKPIKPFQWLRRSNDPSQPQSRMCCKPNRSRMQVVITRICRRGVDNA